MKFPYFKLPSKDTSKKFFEFPWIPVVITVRDKKKAFLMLVDSGADNCILDRDLAEFLGINLPDGALVKTEGLSSSADVYYFENIYINVGGYEVKTRAGFINGYLAGGKISGILGRQGFFEYFKVCIDEKHKGIELKAR